MNILELLKLATPSPEPMFSGEWSVIAFRPDLGSQQEFIVGVAAAIDGDRKPHIKWLPSLAKLCALYGEAISSSDAGELLRGSELAIGSSFRQTLDGLDSGTPHVRIVSCGYIGTHNVDAELTQLLKRHSGALWVEKEARDNPMDDDWAYSRMLEALSTAQVARSAFLPGRSVLFNGKSLKVALDNKFSFGNIVSARYSQFQTVERHIFQSLRQVMTAHKFSGRATLPALFVILPEAGSSLETLLSKRSAELLLEVADMGALQFCDPEPLEVAKKIVAWAERS